MDNPLEIDESYPSLPEKSEEVLEKLENSDPEQVQLILEVCKQLFTIGQQRGRDVEQKASILIGTMGVAVAISTAIGAFLVVRLLGGQVFMASLALGLTLPAAVFLLDPATAFTAHLPEMCLAILTAALFFYTHRSNIRGFRSPTRSSS